jgi:hypothetical protein
MRAKKRVRITRKEIEKAKQDLTQAKEFPLIKPKAKREKSQWGKDFWYGEIYCNSSGYASIVGNDLKEIWLGRTDELIPFLKHKGIDGENYNMIIQAAQELREEKKSQSCHSATRNAVTPINTKGESPHRATFKDNPRFLGLLDGLIIKGYGIPTVQGELKKKGYDIPYRTLGRWISKRRANLELDNPKSHKEH